MGNAICTGKERIMPEFCKTERDGRLFIVTINRPDVMNSLHPMANAELEKAFDEFAEDPELWVAIVTGAGDKAFSAGNDLKFQAAMPAGQRPRNRLNCSRGSTSCDVFCLTMNT